MEEGFIRLAVRGNRFHRRNISFTASDFHDKESNVV